MQRQVFPILLLKGLQRSVYHPDRFVGNVVPQESHTIPIRRASSTGRFNTLYSVDPTTLLLENQSARPSTFRTNRAVFWLNQGSRANLALASHVEAFSFEAKNGHSRSESVASCAEPAARRFPAFDVITDHLDRCSDRDRQNEPYGAPKPSPQQQRNGDSEGI
jgi:hypothetical protein